MPHSFTSSQVLKCSCCFSFAETARKICPRSRKIQNSTGYCRKWNSWEDNYSKELCYWCLALVEKVSWIQNENINLFVLSSYCVYNAFFSVLGLRIQFSTSKRLIYVLVDNRFSSSSINISVHLLLCLRMCHLLVQLLPHYAGRIAALLILPVFRIFALIVFVTFSTHRAMQFIIIFLQEVLTGEPDLVKCAKKAYEGSLKKFHGWMVQGIFSVSFTSLATFTAFDIWS